MADPFELDLPDEWTYTTSDHRVEYEDADSSVRITVEEFAKQLTLYWWVDVYVRDGDDWERRELGLGDTYRSPEAVTEDVQHVVDAVSDGALDSVAYAASATPDGG